MLCVFFTRLFCFSLFLFTYNGQYLRESRHPRDTRGVIEDADMGNGFSSDRGRHERSRLHRAHLAGRSEFSIVKIDTHDNLNKRAHHTDQFKSKAVILRRGQDFLLDVYPTTKFDNSQHFFTLELWTGNKPREFDRTLIKVKLGQYIEKRKWGMRRIGTDDTKIQLRVNIPSNCLIAKYQLRIKNEEKRVLYKHSEPVYILFNPWSTDDEVFMSNTGDLDEYVLNDQGILFQGSAEHISPFRWYFGQFEEVALEAVFELLKPTKLRGRDTARDIARRLSAVEKGTSQNVGVKYQVNANDEGGVIAGKWSEDYSEGTEPWAWTGSPEILEQYMQSKRPVKYGQCWNFCGVCTTLLRAIGIPTRAISNFNSAHDTDANCTYDRFYDSNGEFLAHLSTDSTWNFHCWNDAWMERSDLPPGYGGWQAVDATPQERSNGIFQLGPSPLRAIKEGNINMKYDVRFVFAEVNADAIYWTKMGSVDDFKPVRVNRKLIGQNISTKALGKNNFNRVDISSEYKYPEGSALELTTVKRAMHLANNKIIEDTPKDIKFELSTVPNILVGKDVKFRLTMTNTAAKDYVISVMIGGNIVRYNGVSLDKISVKKSDIKINRQATLHHTALFPASEYLKHLHQAPRMRFHIYCTCSETGQIYVTEALVTLSRPELVFENFPSYQEKGKELEFLIRVKNPLDMELTNCMLRLDGNLMEGRLTLPQRNVPARGSIQMPVHIHPENQNKHGDKHNKAVDELEKDE